MLPSQCSCSCWHCSEGPLQDLFIRSGSQTPRQVPDAAGGDHLELLQVPCMPWKQVLSLTASSMPALPALDKPICTSPGLHVRQCRCSSAAMMTWPAQPLSINVFLILLLPQQLQQLKPPRCHHRRHHHHSSSSHTAGLCCWLCITNNNGRCAGLCETAHVAWHVEMEVHVILRKGCRHTNGGSRWLARTRGC